MNTGAPVLDRFDHLTADDRAEIGDILDAALEWKAGRLPIWEFALVGQMPAPQGCASGGYSRFVAMRLTPKTDFRWPVLIEALEALIAWRTERLKQDARAAA